MIIFKKIRFKNFLSYGNIFTEFSLNNSSITNIAGLNGVGKSTLTCAICFVLFNKPFRKINRPNLINFKNKNNLLVEIEFSNNDKNYLVRRGMSPNIFEIFENDILLNQPASTRDYQQILENNILNFDYNSFTQIVILGKATYVSFMRLNPDQRRKFVENILGLNIIGIMNEIHKSGLSELKQKQQDIKNQIIVIQEKIRVSENYIKKLEQDEIKNKEVQEQKIDFRLNEILEEQELFKSEIEQLETLREELNDQEFNKLHERLNKLTSALGKSELQAKRYTKESEFFSNNDTCSTCGQTIDSEFKTDKIQLLTSKATEINNIKTELEQGIIKSNAKLADLNERITINRKTNEKLNLIKSKIQGLTNQYNSLIIERSSIEIKTHSKVEDEQDILEKLLNEYNDLLNFRDEFFETQEYNDVITSLLKDSGFKKAIIHQFIGLINQTINKYLNNLGFYANFRLDEEFNEEILARGINKLNYNNFSEGEKMRIDLAILLTWREIAKLRSNMTTNLLIFDDMLSIVDTQGIKSVVDELTNISGMNTFIISPPNEVLQDAIPNIITIDKINGFSVIN